MYFFTATINNWQTLLVDDQIKKIITDSFSWMQTNGRTNIHAFVIMPNHLHMIMSPCNNNLQAENEFALLSFTGHAFKKYLFGREKETLQKFKSTQADRKFHFWERRSHTKELMSRAIVEQKIDYIHTNPCQPKWNLVANPIDYKFSSANFYENGIDRFGFLSNYCDFI